MARGRPPPDLADLAAALASLLTEESAQHNPASRPNRSHAIAPEPPSVPRQRLAVGGTFLDQADQGLFGDGVACPGVHADVDLSAALAP